MLRVNPNWKYIKSMFNNLVERNKTLVTKECYPLVDHLKQGHIYAYSIDANTFYARPENLLLRGIFLGKKGKKDVFQTPGFFNLYLDKEKYVDLGRYDRFEAGFDSCDNLSETVERLQAKQEAKQDMNIMKRAYKEATKFRRIDKQHAYNVINDAWQRTHSFKKIEKSEIEREKRQMNDNALYDEPFSNMEEVYDNDLYDEPFSNMEEVDGGRRKTKRLKRSKPRIRTKNSAKK